MLPSMINKMLTSSEWFHTVGAPNKTSKVSQRNEMIFVLNLMRWNVCTEYMYEKLKRTDVATRSYVAWHDSTDALYGWKFWSKNHIWKRKIHGKSSLIKCTESNKFSINVNSLTCEASLQCAYKGYVTIISKYNFFSHPGNCRCIEF